MIETKEIKMAPKKMLATLFLQYGMPWTIAGLIGIVVFIVLGIAVDSRFLFLALIWIFLIIPLVVAFLYFFYGMKPLTAFNSIPHKIIFYDDRLEVFVIEKEEGEEENHINPKPYTVEKSRLKEVKNGSDYVILLSKEDGWIWLPRFAFHNMDDFKRIIESFFQNNYATR